MTVFSLKEVTVIYDSNLNLKIDMAKSEYGLFWSGDLPVDLLGPKPQVGLEPTTS
jgi:hypothetical protein